MASGILTVSRAAAGRGPADVSAAQRNARLLVALAAVWRARLLVALAAVWSASATAQAVSAPWSGSVAVQWRSCSAAMAAYRAAWR